MELLYITNQICGAAGLERVLSIKTDYLISKFNYKIHILTLNQGKEELFYDFNENITYHDITAPGSGYSYFKAYKKGLKKTVQKINPDIILVCDDGLKGFFVPYIINKPCPMIYERHVSQNIEHTKDRRSIIDKMTFKIKSTLMHIGGKKYDRFVVLTEDNLAEWKLDNLEVISNPLSFYDNRVGALNSKQVIAVGRHHYQKGFDRLLESWKFIHQKYPDWQLKIVGKINPDLRLQEIAQDMHLTESVSFVPPVKNIQKEYLNSAMCVMPSRFEGFGMVLIEAMALGIPTISFNCPCGPKDIIAHNEDGILVPNDDIQAFTKAIERLITDIELRKEMGSCAKSNVKRYLPQYIVPKWDQLFKTITLKN